MFIANEIFVIDEISSIKSGNESIEKYRKLLKTRKLSKSKNLKDKKLFNSQKLSKLKKKLLKNRNLSNFDAKKNGPSFLTSKAKVPFNPL